MAVCAQQEEYLLASAMHMIQIEDTHISVATAFTLVAHASHVMQGGLTICAPSRAVRAALEVPAKNNLIRFQVRLGVSILRITQVRGAIG
jgi:hypothetical protein